MDLQSSPFGRKRSTSNDADTVDDLEWDGAAIPTAWSRTHQPRAGRAGRTFGNQGKKGGRSVAVAPRIRPVPQKGRSAIEDSVAASSNTAASLTGYLVDESSSPELSTRSSRSMFSAESSSSPTTSFSSSSTTVTDLFPNRQQLTRHARSMSMLGSSTTANLQQQQQHRLARSTRMLHRSASIPVMAESHHLTFPVIDPERECWEENSHPNNHFSASASELDAVETMDDSNGGTRKRRCARRHSIQGFVAIASSEHTDDASNAARNQTTPKPAPPDRQTPDPLAWLQQDTRELSMGPLFPSPSQSSVSSSRKRGVCGSPREASDNDLAVAANSSNSKSWNNHSNTSLSTSSTTLSATTGGSSRPVFDVATANSDVIFPDLPSLRRYSTFGEPLQQRGRSCMNIDDDSDDDGDDEESNANSSAINQSFSSCSSFHNNTSSSSHHALISSHVDKDQSCLPTDSPDYILETMSSYDDLVFLTKALRKEEKRAAGTSSFGRCHSWDVPPPIAWSSSRRSTFFSWTKAQLGFTVRAVGGALTYLQIPRTKGGVVLQNLQAALVEYKKRHPQQTSNDSTNNNNTRKPTTKRQESPLVWTDGSVVAPRQQQKPAVVQERRLSANRLALSSPMDTAADDDFSNLVEELQALTFKESAKKSSTSQQLVRLVTLDPNDDHHNPDNNSKPRQSLDHHVRTKDLMSHLHGLSPNEAPAFKPSKLSMGSVCSTGTTTRAGTPSLHAPIQNLEIVGTPMMADGGWGSRPVPGREWGTSTTCDVEVLAELTRRFEVTCRAEGVRDSFGAEPNRPSNLAFEQLLSSTNDSDNCPEEKQPDEEVPLDPTDERKQRHRMISMAKKKRMSLWASTAQPEEVFDIRQKPLFRARKTLCRLDESLRQSLCLPSHAFQNDEVSSVVCETGTDEFDTLDHAQNEEILPLVFAFLTESELLCSASVVCTAWADAATTAQVNLMLASVGYNEDLEDVEENECELDSNYAASRGTSMEQPWAYLNSRFPWGCFLSEGAFKRVYKVYNSLIDQVEAISVMDIDAIVDKKTVAAELAVSAMLSSLSRRGICPNFVVTRGVFTCPYEPPKSHWGTADNKKPNGSSYDKSTLSRKPREPSKSFPGRFQYIRMELCNEGDAEEYVKRLPNEVMDSAVAQAVLFQIAFALHAAADRFSVKHYDLKLLNIFIQRAEDTMGSTVLRYGLGSHMFALNMPSGKAIFAKLADYGTANTSAESTGRPVTIAQFTTLENTPPDFMILGDRAKQGHGHDCFGLGLCMLHLFTGHAPYEEILEDIKCPPGLKKKLRSIWENESVKGYDVIRSVILSDVYKDEAGNIVDGEPDETLYDTLYRFLVLFGIPDTPFEQKKCPKVWKAIFDSLQPSNSRSGKPVRVKQGSDATRYSRDCRKCSIRSGNNKYIAGARKRLEAMHGGMELLCRLCSFDPAARASAIEVLNSSFMMNLQEPPGGASFKPEDTVFSYTAFSTLR